MPTPRSTCTSLLRTIHVQREGRGGHVSGTQAPPRRIGACTRSSEAPPPFSCRETPVGRLWVGCGLAHRASSPLDFSRLGMTATGAGLRVLRLWDQT